MPQAQPAHESCRERQELVERLREADVRVVALHRDEIAAIRNDDRARLERVWQDLDNAIAQRDSVVDRFNAHVQAHGCRSPGIE